MALSDLDYQVMAYFKRIINTPPSDVVLNIFRRLRASPFPRDREIVRRMLKYLIKEFHLFPSYPVGNLMKMANFLGGFVQYELITDEDTLTTIIGYIFYDLKSSNGNAFNFSFTALNRFKMQLKKFPKLCCRLSKINDFKNFPLDLVKYIEYGMQGVDPPSKKATEQGQTTCNKEVAKESQDFIVPDVIPESLAITPVAVYVSPVTKPPGTIPIIADVPLRPETPATILKAVDLSPTPEPPASTPVESDVQIVSPPRDVQVKVRSTINALGKTNLQTKGREIRNLIADEHLPWLSKYIVMKRVRNEFNLHGLYSGFLDGFDSEVLNSLIIIDTLKKVRILLKRNVGIPSMLDKYLIKNFGHWLGVITLAKNKPIPKADIDLEDLLVKASEKGAEELLFVVQFITKILESCSGGNFSSVSRWTTSMMNHLFELYDKPKTKLQVKVEIEKLCKALNVKLKVRYQYHPNYRAKHILNQPHSYIIE